MRTLNQYLSSDSENSSLSYNGSTSVRHKNNSSNSLFANSGKHLCPLNILKFSCRRTTSIGSATATICVLNKKDLTALNLGDSGFILIRFDNATNEPYILIKSIEQTHSFNSPY